MRNEFSKRSLKIIDKGIALNYKDKIHQLYFDSVFDENYSQQKVFESACMPIVNDVLQGNNACLFVYGQTGTGKTFTMGTLETIKREDQGLIPLALNHIINTLMPIQNYKQSIDLINAGLKYRKIGNQKVHTCDASRTVVNRRPETIDTASVTVLAFVNRGIRIALSRADVAALACNSGTIERANTAGARRIAVIAAIVPTIRVLIAGARRNADGLIDEEVVTVDTGSALDCIGGAIFSISAETGEAAGVALCA
ncbi:unnamed protein product [Sphagnum balticum]